MLSAQSKQAPLPEEHTVVNLAGPPTTDEKTINAQPDNSHMPTTIDAHAERQLLWKLDLSIIPIVMLLYLLNNLDRVNIGNARLFHLEEDLNLYGNRYQLAVSILFVTYVPSELPSNLLLKKVRPSRWIAFIATSWGIIATLTGVVQSYGGLIAARLCLGLVEGGLFPGMAVYLTMFYTRREIALRIGYLFVSSALSGAFGGLLAYAIGFLDGAGGLSGWRWILIIEGLPAIVLGISCWFLLADDYHTAWYLTSNEKLLMRMRFAQQQGMTTSAEQFAWADVKKGLKDWKVWGFCLGQTGMDTMLYGYSTFLPTIIKSINPSWSAQLVQILTIPCYATGAVSYVATAWLSDRQQLRGLYVVGAGLISIVGYAVLATPVSSAARYFATFLVAIGLYVAVGIPLAWLPTNSPRYGKRTTATGLQLTLGNIAGIWAPFLYPTSDGPRYVVGHASTLALVALSCGIYAFFSCYFAWRNGRRREGKENASVAGMSEDEVAELGDDSPKFIFTT